MNTVADRGVAERDRFFEATLRRSDPDVDEAIAAE